MAKKSSAAGADFGSAAKYEMFLPEAAKLPKNAVRPMRADVHLAASNATEGATAVLAHEEVIRRELPKISVPAIAGLGGLASAVIYAAGEVERYAPPPTDTKALLARAHDLRAIFLSTADALARAKILPATTVAKIHQGHGGIDTAGDCVALAALFQKNAKALKGKVPFSAADVKEAADAGTKLLAVLRPKSAGRKPHGKGLIDATDARDRLWTLFETQWEEHVWRSGAYLFGRKVDAHVPPLQSRVAGKRPAKMARAPQPDEKP